ncbi:MAG: CRISPR-associated protein Cas4 [Bacillota bacterium]
MKLRGRHGCWRPSPVEYKRGKPKTTDVDRVQVCAQAMCLEEMFRVSIDAGAIYYWEVRSREPVWFDRQLRLEVERLSESMHRLFRVGQTPKVDGHGGCRKCSLKDICLPGLASRSSASSYLKRVIKELYE